MSKVHYHFDHVGSYLRPQALKEAREKFANGEISQGIVESTRWIG